jgi:hypothetical protein
MKTALEPQGFLSLVAAPSLHYQQIVSVSKINMLCESRFEHQAVPAGQERV